MTGPARTADDVHIEDQGPPDQYGRVEAIVRIAGERVARMFYAAWPEHLVIYEAAWEPEAPVEAEQLVLQRLLQLYPEETPARITHSGVSSLPTLRWYHGTHLRPGLVVCGSYGSRTLFYDPIGALDLSVEPEPMLEGFAAATLTVMYLSNLRAYGETAQPTLEDVYAWLVEGDAMGRFVAIRRLVVDPHVDPAVTRAALFVALLNENSGVRQFASIHLGGYFPELQIRADVRRINALLADPFEIWAMLGREAPPELPGWDPAQGRRNARYALAWTLGNVCWNAQGWGAVDWAEEEAAEVRALLEASLPRLDAARDRWLYELALRDFSDDPTLRFGFGTPEPVDLLDFLRYAVLRWGIVQRLGFKGVDRFYWLVTSVEGVVGAAPGEGEAPASEVAARVYAPPPSDELPAVNEMPAWMYGQNHYELYAPVDVDHEVVA
jgi:hypothetical protein